jgi:hypothetical protein
MGDDIKKLQEKWEKIKNILDKINKNIVEQIGNNNIIINDGVDMETVDFLYKLPLNTRNFNYKPPNHIQASSGTSDILTDIEEMTKIEEAKAEKIQEIKRGNEVREKEAEEVEAAKEEAEAVEAAKEEAEAVEAAKEEAEAVEAKEVKNKEIVAAAITTLAAHLSSKKKISRSNIKISHLPSSTLPSPVI